MSTGAITSQAFSTPTILDLLPPNILVCVAETWKMTYDAIHTSSYLYPRFLKANLLKRANYEVLTAKNRNAAHTALNLISLAKAQTSFDPAMARKVLAETARFVVAQATIVKVLVSMGDTGAAKTFVLRLEPSQQRELLYTMITLADSSDLSMLQELLRLAREAPSLRSFDYEHALALLTIAALQTPKDAYATLTEAMQKAEHISIVSQYVEINSKVAEVAAQLGDLKTAQKRLRSAEARVIATQRFVSAHDFIPVMRAKAAIGLPIELPDELEPTGRGLIEVAKGYIKNKDYGAARQTLEQAKAAILDPPELEDIPPVEGFVAIAKLQRSIGDHSSATCTLAQAKELAKPLTIKMLTEVFSVEQYIDPEQAQETLKTLLLLAKNEQTPFRRTRDYIAIASAIDTRISHVFAPPSEEGPVKKVRRQDKMTHVPTTLV